MKIAIIGLIISLILLVGCTQSISEIKDEKFVGEKIAVRGTVEKTIKIGQLSGYSLVDENGDRISVSSDNLPAEGSEVTVKGTLMKEMLIGYYIKVE